MFTKKQKHLLKFNSIRNWYRIQRFTSLRIISFLIFTIALTSCSDRLDFKKEYIIENGNRILSLHFRRNINDFAVVIKNIGKENINCDLGIVLSTPKEGSIDNLVILFNNQLSREGYVMYGLDIDRIDRNENIKDYRSIRIDLNENEEVQISKLHRSYHEIRLDLKWL